MLDIIRKRILRRNSIFYFEYVDVNGERGSKPFGQTTIGDTFKGHTEYMGIKLHGIRSIDEGAFDGCTELVELHIPKSVEYIHPEAFANCPNLSRVVFERGILNIELTMTARCSVEMSLLPPFKNFLEVLPQSYGARLSTTFDENPSANNWR